ncbi:cupin domain-containing protein [Halobacterium zhouii]|uniref:cupin domain-containing protein n=1 Tax=Halobacterium zhouii TaxID=2902624 RepID=UPI001E40D588|nr:cupin domain-containing protein [Halobacterium zhouii]
MGLDRYPDLNPAPKKVQTTELYYSSDLLVKAFALGPGAEVDTHEHAEQTNVFHVLEGRITVVAEDDEEEIAAPGVVVHERESPHGARNDTDDQTLFTATMGPME